MDLNEWDAELGPTLSVEVRVKQGMALLDERGPERWWEFIDLDTLRLENTCQCVLGQLYGGFLAGGDAVGLFRVLGASAEHGFVGIDAAASDELDAAWRDAIEARRREEAQRL